MTAYEGELLPAVRSNVPMRHAVCGYQQRRAQGPFAQPARVLAFCGAPVDLPMRQHETEDKCHPCLELAQTHGLECDCWKLWPKGRIPS